jgi:membrane fusion protein, adhesin transport system
MLNLSNNRINHKIDPNKLESFGAARKYKSQKVLKKLLNFSILLFAVILFIPWTQNIRAKGYVTTLTPGQRPQTIQSVIPGRIEKWFVTEGDYVAKGDTILFISEIKGEYFDPNLVERTDTQIKAKELSVKSYMEKVKALDNQIDALINIRKLKTQQSQNYVKQALLAIQSDSANVQNAENDFVISERQLKRTETLYEEGLKSLTDLEKAKMKVQKTKAKRIEAENKLLTSRNKLINAKVDLESIESLYRDKLSKAESTKFTALSNMYDAEGQVTKMQIQYMNYSMRTGLYYITAPQNGYITQAIKTGIGETIKAGDKILSIMPADHQLAVTMYVEPMDLPLMKVGEDVRIVFDGWPAIVFSGWPGVSHGTFGGRVVAIDNFISENGKYRVLIAEHESEDHHWPDLIKIGAGVKAFALLEDVPIWYELWRNINGFPPNFYQGKTKETKKNK